MKPQRVAIASPGVPRAEPVRLPKRAVPRVDIEPSAAVILALSLFSFFLTCFFFLRDGALYWDNGQHFSQFRDNLDSLNRYGQIAWWFPHIQGGWPSYYYSILGFPHGASPLFALVAFACWIAGVVGVSIRSFLPIYVAYFGLLTPLLFLFSVRAFARTFLKSNHAVVYALVLAAFSPGVMLNISDVGFLEPAAYGLFFGAAVLRFLRTPTRRTYWMLGLSLIPLGLSLNFAFLFWDAVAIPIFLIVVLVFAGRRRRAIVAALRWPGAKGWAILCGLFILAALPNLVAYAQGHDELIKPHLGGVSYSFEQILPGNPLTSLAVSLPGFGSKWAPQYRANWALAEKTTGEHIGYIYLGLLCLPLVIVGLIFGRSPIRVQLLAVLLMIFGIVNLAAHSPLFAAILALPTPLRSNNHYSDLLQRSGAFLVLVFAAAFGLDTVLRGTAHVRRTLYRLFAASTALGLLVYAVVHEEDTLLRPTFGFSVLMAFLGAVVLYKLSEASHHRVARVTSLALLALALVDVSTHAFLHVRRVIHRGKGYDRIDERASPTGIGMADLRENAGPDGYYFVSSVLKLRSLIDLNVAGFKLTVPELHLFSAAHPLEDLAREKEQLTSGGFAGYYSIALDPEAAGHPALRPFVEAGAAQPIEGRYEGLSRTYNELRLRVASPRPALLFMADAYFPYWRATVDGRSVPVLRGLRHFKVVPVPAGVSEVHLSFSPPWIPFTLFAAYAALVAAAIHAWRIARRRRQRA